jgi:hypothetical protein
VICTLHRLTVAKNSRQIFELGKLCQVGKLGNTFLTAKLAKLNMSVSVFKEHAPVFHGASAQHERGRPVGQRRPYGVIAIIAIRWRLATTILCHR